VNEEELTRLEALCNAATAGPWKAENIPYRLGDGDTVDMWDVHYERDNDGLWYAVGDSYDEPTAQFVAAARTALPLLIAELRQTQAILHRFIEEPYGCPFCDSGKLRNPVKGHTSDCAWRQATEFLGSEAVQ